MSALCPATPRPDAFRLMAIPMLYAVWERCFVLCHSIGLKLLRDLTTHTHALSPSQRALWLQKASFYESYRMKLQQTARSSKSKPGKGSFAPLCEFLEELEKWEQQPISQSQDVGELVMTFSNVNPEVVSVNAETLGIATDSKFQSLNLGRLNDLVGRRNDIGHGGLVTPPGERDFASLWKYTEELVTDYCDAFISWIATTAANSQITVPGIQSASTPIVTAGQTGTFATAHAAMPVPPMLPATKAASLNWLQKLAAWLTR